MPRPNLVPRARLMSRLAEGLTRKLTLVSAPAGFGKTTLLSEWRAENGHARPLAWLTLDEADNDVVRFWSYAIAALETIDVFIDVEAKALLQATSPQIEAVLGVLVNALASQPLDRVFVLDDYHLVRSEAVNGSLAFFIEHVPPTLHLVILSRADPQLPLARLRVRDQLVELRASDLRCTRDEMAAFFTRAVGLTLTDRAVSALDARTEGWLAGLQLVALSVRDRTVDQAEQFIASLTGAHPHILDYLVEEVLQRQPEDVRDFLLKTSILRQLNASVCEAVTGQTRARTMLTQLERANLFLEPLDAAGQWYRYHRLFGEVLLVQLQLAQPEILPELHRRACEWYAHQGLIHEAMRHALAARQYEWAAALLEREYRDMVFRGELITVRSWLDALPRELVRVRTRLNLAYTYASVYTSRYEEMEKYLAQAEAALPRAAPADQRTLRGEMLTLRAINQAVRGDVQAVESARAALTLIPTDDLQLQLMAHHALGSGYRLLGRPIEAEPALLRAIEIAEPLRSAMGVIVGSVRLGQARVMRGHLRRAAQAFEHAISYSSELSGEALLYAGEAHIRLGDVYREWNDLDSAAQHLTTGIELAQHANPVALLSGYFSRMRLQWILGEPASALETWRQAERLAASFDFPHLSERVVVHRAWLDFASGQVEAAQAWADAYLATRAALREQIEVPIDMHETLLARVLIRQDRAPEALRVLEELRVEVEETERGWTLIQTLSLQALALEAQHQHDQALSTLRQAITLAEPEGYIRLFVDEGEEMRRLLDDLRLPIRRQTNRRLDAYLSKLLAAFPPAAGPHVEHARPGSRDLIEPLTARELEILRLLASGASNQQIADRLVIGLGTVKAHLNHIFGKLNAHNRVEAIAKAQALGLLDQI